MRDWFRARGEHLLKLATVLDAAAAREAHDAAFAQARQDPWASTTDIGAADAVSVRSLIESVGLNEEARVTLVWASTHDACVITFGNLIAWFDHWWYPSSDDLWVIDSDGHLLIEIDNEEIVRIARPRAKP